MRIPDAIHAQTSPALAQAIARVLDDPAAVTPTLADVRRALAPPRRAAGVPLDRFTAERLAGLRQELDHLMARYGGQAPAVRFVPPWVSDGLRQLIRAALGTAPGASLAAVQEAADGGLLTHLVKRGGLAPVEAGAVTDELAQLMARHGPDAPARRFLGGRRRPG